MPGEVNRDATCLFCHIVAGEVPATVVGEDERTLAFLDINPASDGHALVVPKAHAADLGAADPEDVAATARAAQALGARMRERLGADGVNVLTAWGEAAWQTVFHLHWHVIPRYAGDEARDRLRLPWTPSPGDPAVLAAVAARLTAP
ncbi:HIT family protein [Nocardioides bruguierae]|uniref:HIT family protein n=1 Tax=Nocardioides bruguierae TaxID=2945102 RepID=UPI002021DFD7|nr:HIT domain-containing protein [Nocardioides bruguierae]MCL8024097.1 HIT domain-containing protein [Nocardioides bruguierae]